jgi:hypothetical protein
MGQQRVFLKLVKRSLGVVVIHEFPRQRNMAFALYSRRNQQANFAEGGIGNDN